MTLLTTKTGFYYLALACLIGAYPAVPRRWCARRSARCCAASARTRPRRWRSATTPASTRSPSSPSPTRSAGWPARSMRRSPGFANTELLFWLLSGQVLIMVIVGGSGTLIGPDPRRRVLPASGASALLVHRGVGAVPRPRLHCRRAVRAGGHLGPGDELARRATRRRRAGGLPPWLTRWRSPRRTRSIRASAARDRRPDEALRRARCRRQRQHAGRGRRGARRHRTQRRRQDDAVPPDHRRRQADDRPRALCRPRHNGAHRARRSASAGCRARSSSRRCFRRCPRARTSCWPPRPGIRGAGSRSAAAASLRRRAAPAMWRSSSSG